MIFFITFIKFICVVRSLCGNDCVLIKHAGDESESSVNNLKSTYANLKLERNAVFLLLSLVLSMNFFLLYAIFI